MTVDWEEDEEGTWAAVAAVDGRAGGGQWKGGRSEEEAMNASIIEELSSVQMFIGGPVRCFDSGAQKESGDRGTAGRGKLGKERR